VGLAVDHAIANPVHDRWLARSPPVRIAAAGFETDRVDAHPYLAEGEPAHFMTLPITMPGESPWIYNVRPALRSRPECTAASVPSSLPDQALAP
jgi:hypothetical protein